MPKNTSKKTSSRLAAAGLMFASAVFSFSGISSVKAASPINSTPVLFPLDGFPANVEMYATINYQLTAIDPDGDVLTYAMAPQVPGAALDSQTGLFTWTPANIATLPAQYTIEFSVSDGIDSAMVPVTVAVVDPSGTVNQAPVLSPISDQTVIAGQTLSFTAKATDPNNDPLIFTYPGGFPIGASLSPEGIFSWTPTSSQVGSYTLSISASDGSLSDSKSFIVTVSSTNQAPVLAPISNQTATVGQKISLQLSASDPNNDPLTFSSQNSLPAGASLSSTGLFSWTPTSSQVGNFTISAVVSDGQLSDSKSFTVAVKTSTVTTNQPPVIAPLAEQYIKVGEELKFRVTATDPNGDRIRFSASDLPRGASFDSSGQFKWKPSSYQTGKYTVKIKASDGKASSSIYVVIYVTRKAASWNWDYNHD